MSTLKLELLAAAREGYVRAGGGGICYHLTKASGLRGLDAHYAASSIKLRVHEALVDRAYYHSWLIARLRRLPTPEEVYNGRLKWLDQMIEAEHTGMPFPPPPLPPGADL